MNSDPQVPESIRAFVCLPLPAQVPDAVRMVQRHLEDHLPSDGIRWAPPDQLHLTLRFLGQVAAVEIPALSDALSKAGRAATPFRLNLAGCGCFPEPARPRVVWIGIGGETATLLDLQRRVEAAVAGHGDHLESRPFSPHLTLARIRPGSRAARALAAVLRTEPPVLSVDWIADALHLMQSKLEPRGARHTLLASIPFGMPRLEGSAPSVP